MAPRSTEIVFSMEQRAADAKSSIYAAAHPAQFQTREAEEEENPTAAVKAEARVKSGNLRPPATELFAFVYGTLKRGFGNYWLMEELTAKGNAHFAGVAETKERFPLVCGPFQVPFLLNVPEAGYRVVGEVYRVDEAAMERLDELEGVSKGHYVRRAVAVMAMAGGEMVCVRAEAYFAASSYAAGLAKRCSYIDCFTQKEASTYVPRKDRPQHLTFLEHVWAWIEEQEDDDDDDA